MIVITNKTRGLRVVSRGESKKPILLIPGANKFQDGEVDVKTHGIKALQDAGDIEINLGTGAETLPDFPKLKRDEALAVVKATADKTTLEEYRAQTKDTIVIGAIKERLADIDQMERDIEKAKTDAANGAGEA